jgi:mRNA interferase MazF
MDPLRGEVWDARIPVAGEHPAVVLTINPMIGRLSAVTVAVITGTAGPAPTHVELGPEAGLTRHDISYANATDLHSVDRSRLRKRRGRLHPGEMQCLEEAIRTYVGL